ncbi:hypothetical protein VTN31DRAFT_6309 [Thermomyces dupontii]|uniref:uncharacterized protein n=1 Tax=Talaromyces thermophilus TaxID=28565 RepID=UPI003742A711
MSQQSDSQRDPIARFVGRMGSVLRRNKTKKNGESSKSSPAPEKSDTKPAKSLPTSPTNGPIAIDWSYVQQERARALFAKYGFTLEPHEWMSPQKLNIERVEKPIRMRVRRTCHRCQTTFGANKVCAGCQHVRCKKCPRYPPARSKEEKEARAREKERKAKAAQASKSEAHKRKVKEPYSLLTVPSRTGGQDLVYKPIRRRVRRTCHRCDSVFQEHVKECATCGHIRCKRCPRDPPNLEKYPNGYPGDADPPPERPQRTFKKPRMRVRYVCDQCETIYQPHEKTCRGCGKEKGPDTKRIPPKKPKKEPDPEVLKRLEERLGGIKLT